MSKWLTFYHNHNLKKFLKTSYFVSGCVRNMEKDATQEISEGLAKIKTEGKVFYNPVQEFNRDLSISVLSVFARNYKNEKLNKTKGNENDVNVIISKSEESYGTGVRHEDGISILEALSATGLRSIRYAKEIPGVKEIIANDISKKAVNDIKSNIQENNVEHLVKPSNCDATLLMHQHNKENRFDAIDLDPYGCPSVFLDSAVQAIHDGGLLLVTATDMAVLAGNSPETCHVKYGAVSLKIKSCHEMALRILLQCIESHANRYGRYIVPLLSLSVDFYIRVFVRIYSGPNKCKYSTSKLSHVYLCSGCETFTLQPLGLARHNPKTNQVKFTLPTGPPVGLKCEHCGHSHHLGGPIWSGPLHSPEFIQEVLNSASDRLSTYKRIIGVLSVIKEELTDVPLYYTIQKLSATLHIQSPPMLNIRSAILNAGFRVSYTHANKCGIKTDAPPIVIWDIMRCWESKHPINQKRLIENSPASHILSVNPQREYSFELHPDAKPESKRKGLLRFQENPLPHWGPGTRATAMIGDKRMIKSFKNQGKRKREHSEENEKDK